MKNLVTAILFAFVITSCSDKKATETVQPEPESNVMLEEPKPVDSAAIAKTGAEKTFGENTSISEGKALIEGADCLACHQVDTKLVGPAYQDVAAKYSDADIDHLTTKIIEGGKGVWGEIPMTAHAGMSKENAQKMVRYILSLKK